MKMTRERKIYGVVLAVAVTAMGIDQMLGSEATQPHTAEAGITTTPAAPALPLTAVKVTHEQSPHNVNAWLVKQLDDVQAGDADAFKVPAAWLNSDDAASDNGAKAAGASPYRLRAVMMSDDGGLALINDRYVKRGQQIDGLTLVEVRTGGVVLASDHQRIELKLDHAKLSNQDR